MWKTILRGAERTRAQSAVSISGGNHNYAWLQIRPLACLGRYSYLLILMQNVQPDLVRLAGRSVRLLEAGEHPSCSSRRTFESDARENRGALGHPAAILHFGRNSLRVAGVVFCPDARRSESRSRAR
jgi:hypothetical protein